MEIAKSHRYLLNKSGTACLSTLSRDGSIQSSLIWYDFAEGHIRVNTLLDSPKEKNIRRTKTATLLIADPENQNIYLTLRTSLRSIEREGAAEHLNLLTQRQMGVDRWYGGVEEEDRDAMERRVIIYLLPVVQYAAAE